MAEEQSYDLIVIGGGLYGIQAARTYLEVHPTANIIVFESDSCVGGVWSSSRMYDAFQTQTPLRIAEFSDWPLRDVPENECYFDFFPASYLTTYFEDYVKNHVYHGRRLVDRFQFNSHVERLTKRDDKTWAVTIKEKPGLVYTATKVMDASGLTSDPNIPKLPGIETYKGRALHQKQFGSSDILTNPSVRDIVVLGGAKSAADVAYAAAKAGKRVSWVIRKSGAGPCAFVPAAGPGPYRNSNESTYTRVFGTFLASIFMKPSWWLSFLYHTRWGQWLHKQFWEGINQDAIDLAGFENSDRRINGFENLRTDTAIFWQNDSTGVNQRTDFFDVVSSKCHVYRQDVVGMTENSMQLAGGPSVPCDVLMYATGWRHAHPHISNSEAARLGLPVEGEDDVAVEKRWAQLQAEVEHEATDRFPLLKQPPWFHKSSSRSTPFRLYKTIVPLNDPSITFLGMTMLGNNFRNAEAQALWATAVLDGKVKLPGQERMEKDVARTIAWNRHRYLAKGALGNWFYFDVVPYTDMLLEQLGLSSHRKWWFKDLFQPAFAGDLKGLIPEYRRWLDQQVQPKLLKQDG